MTAFAVGMALGSCAAALLPTGIAHLLRPAAFGELVAAHGVVPARVAPVVAVGTAVAEVATGGAAVGVLLAGGPAWPVLGAGLLLGGAFVAYLAVLLRRPDTGVGCGCTPLSGPVTRMSLLPGGTLAAACALALAGPASAPAWFAVAWGVTLMVAVLLVPASSPTPEPA